jgi:hypothetical protein
MNYIQTILLIGFCFVMTACKKQVASLTAPENEIVSEVEVSKSGRPVLDIGYLYDNYDRMIRMNIEDLLNGFREEVEFEYGPGGVRINVRGIFSSGNENRYSVILLADENLIINAYTFEPAGGSPKTYTFNRDENGRLISFLEQPNGFEVSYDDYGISTTRMLTNGDLSNPLYRIELLEPDLFETYVPGINNVAIIPELRRDAYPLQPFFLGNLSYKLNPSPLNLPERSTLSGEDEAKPITFHYQYARDVEGRIIEMRKFTKDFLTDYRVQFSYIPKQLPY